MNNTTKRSLTAIAAILMAATLVVGTAGTVTTKTAFAAASNNNNSGNTVTIEECKNRGSASGFDTALDQECENLICTHPGDNATCVQEGAAVAPKPTPVKLTCEQCFTSLLTQAQITTFLKVIAFETIADVCTNLQIPGISSQAGLERALKEAGIGVDTIDQLIACLRDAGVVFTT
jgi:hypothetical protein